ncbi:MAG: HD domain-containing protein [Clostridia bacterium]|nr:HD domain-containing protein [Clostridia bacterium]
MKKNTSVKTVNISAFEILQAFSNALDLVSPLVSNHQIRVAYISFKIAQKYGLKKENIENLVFAACIHDIGATTVKERNDIISPNYESDGRHEKIGYYYTKESKVFSKVADIIRYHHQDWNYGKGEFVNHEKVPMECHIIHLADRIEAFLNKNEYVLYQVDSIIEKIMGRSNTWFKPDLVDTFIELAKNESFWLYAVSNNVHSVLYKEAKLPKFNLNIDELLEVTSWFSNIIDFRSRFTSVHSRGVAESAQALAQVIGLKDDELKIMKIAGYLHDLGKLAVPNSILEKDGKLTKEEFEVIRCHTFHTYNILSHVKGLKDINKYAAYHHEKLDGTGYPFHVGAKEMKIQARIMAVADIFTAIAEDRPYRVGMSKDAIINLLTSKGDDKSLDSKVVNSCLDNFEYVNKRRIDAQNKAREEYEEFWKQIQI